MPSFRRNSGKINWLLIFLILAVGSLLLQLEPLLRQLISNSETSDWLTMVYVLDVRRWPREAWFAANLVFVLMLVTVRFAPNVKSWWNERRSRGRQLSKQGKSIDSDAEYEARVERDKEWRERAKRRLPFQ